MSSYRVPFNKPGLAGNELYYIADAITRGHSSGDGHYTHKCQSALSERMNGARTLLTTSCTDALEMAALLLEIKPGDEVIVPSFTFVSTVNAFVLRGARPIFADIRPDTLNMDETRLEKLITPRTRAIVPVHYAGVGCNMTGIMQLAAKYGVPVVEDNAHGLFARYEGKPLGTFGALATQSFHETKNIICGEGGALVINDPLLAERAEILREKGTNRSRYFRGQVDKYTWVDVGSSFLPSDLLAAFLWAQLERFEEIHLKRQRVWDRYAAELAGWAYDNDVRLHTVPAECEQAYHMFYMLMPSLEARQALIEHLKSRGVLSVFHYVPLHLSDMGRQFGGFEGQCRVTEDISCRLLRLPFYNDLTREDQNYVVRCVQEFACPERTLVYANASA